MLAGQVIVGASASTTVTVKEQVAVLPPTSVARYVTVVVPTGKLPPGAGPDTSVTGTGWLTPRSITRCVLGNPNEAKSVGVVAPQADALI
jgi:hypothetical protein